MMEIVSFIPEQLLILVAALNVLGYGCKSIPGLDNKFIPSILLVLGIIFSIWIQGIDPNSILQGILCWGVAIGVHQTVKQFKN
ncbi:phage holin family protein [Clostridioides mangenotii]|nr:phage holin family protein [Clostridioides mangenotii]